MRTKADKGELIFTVFLRTSFMDNPPFPKSFPHNLLFCHGSLILRILQFHHMVFGGLWRG